MDLGLETIVWVRRLTSQGQPGSGAIMSLEFPLATLTRQQPNYSQMWTPIHDLERYYLGQVTHEEELAKPAFGLAAFLCHLRHLR